LSLYGVAPSKALDLEPWEIEIFIEAHQERERDEWRRAALPAVMRINEKRKKGARAIGLDEFLGFDKKKRSDSESNNNEDLKNMLIRAHAQQKKRN
jgi:hypothetical protein